MPGRRPVSLDGDRGEFVAAVGEIKLRPQFVQTEPFQKIVGQRARTIEKIMLGRGRKDQKIEQDFALRREQRRKAGAARRKAENIIGHETVQKFAGVRPLRFDDAAIVEKDCLHLCSC